MAVGYERSDTACRLTVGIVEEGRMLGRLINAVTRLGGASDLDSYVINLHHMNTSVAPTRDEAKRDYVAAIRVATPWGRF